MVEDRRDHGCGYDFFCSTDGHPACLEVKTFVPDGRVVITTSELQAAAAHRSDYYLVGVVDTGGSPSMWETRILKDPLQRLLANGEVRVDMQVAAPANVVFAE